jgi:hypothetical protein
LLHLSPYGFHEGMHGRYSMLGDSYERCRLGLERLRAVLRAWEADGASVPPRILGLPDRDSQILASAAAKLFGLPLVDYHPDKPGLIIAYDLQLLAPETPTAIFEHRPGQILYAHANCWTVLHASADLTTDLYQSNRAPWGENLRISASDEVETIPADYAPVTTLAARIVAASPTGVDEFPGDTPERLVDFARAVRPAASAFCEAGRRSPLWRGSPVTSNLF